MSLFLCQLVEESIKGRDGFEQAIICNLTPFLLCNPSLCNKKEKKLTPTLLLLLHL